MTARRSALTLVGTALVAAAIATTVTLSVTSASADSPSAKSADRPSAAAQASADARAATARYQDIARARADGFSELKDKAGIACIDNPAGGMGIHYVLGSRVGDPAEAVTTPEVLVYEPQKNGQLKLVAVEYVVLKDAWEKAGNTAPPSLYGEEFELVPATNRYGLPEFYELHSWLWRNNPSGQFEDWNPKVTCSS